mmetsp:Transcript_7932/g.15792  ORF Transcript_7932/g.15792 Transcript_7932/m.15792 type:complete len:286 (+) Transcript_7932:172-1029(+)
MEVQVPVSPTSAPTSATTTSVPMQSQLTPEAALAILAERRTMRPATRGSGEMCEALPNAPVRQGQTIDLFETAAPPPKAPPGFINLQNRGFKFAFSCPCHAGSSTPQNCMLAPPEAAADDPNSTALLTHMSSMSLPLVARHILSAQSSRDLVYSDYNSKFVAYQRSSTAFDSKAYMELVASATVHFSVISKVVLTALKEMERRGAECPPSIVEGVKNLQAHEADRLQITASLHLSTVRLLEASGADEDRTKELLREEVETARVRLEELMETIEEDKEEIREATLL